MRVSSADVESRFAWPGNAGHHPYPPGGPARRAGEHPYPPGEHPYPPAARARRPSDRARRARRRRLLVAVSALGALAMGMVIVLVVSDLEGASRAPIQAAALRAVPSASANSSAMGAIPNSVAVVKDPSKYAAGSPASTAGTASASAGPKTGTGSARPVQQGTGPASGMSPVQAGGTVAAGNSKANCIIVPFAGGVLDQSVINAASDVTGVTYDCLGTFANPMPTWADWEAPWMFSTTSDGWDAWLAANPSHQVIMGMDLIPQSVSSTSDPLNWEQPCAAGSYSQYATALARNLVSYGAGSIVIRLGVEANGNWEADYVGTTTQEMNDWAQCFDNEVTAMRAVPGAHFLFVWNPNICVVNIPLSQWYPGNSYVDIVGADAYDVDCSTNDTVSQEGWSAYANDSHANTPNDPNFPSLDNIAAYAAANGKPLAFPEWGLGTGEPDDAAYVADMAQMFSQKDFSFQSYFDTNDDSIAPLGSSIPNATAAYARGF